MDYLILKELKDKGFPSKYLRIGEYFEHRVGSHSDDWGGESDYPCHCNEDRLPTLSELIEACGDEFACLSASRVLMDKIQPEREGHISDWTAHRFDEKEEWCGEPECCPECGGKGDTPEEAVARLWLVINKTKHEKKT